MHKGEPEEKIESGSQSADVFDVNDSLPDQSFEFSDDKYEYISLADAAKYTKFSQDYISLLARNQKIPAKKFGRNWKVRMVDVNEYISRTEKKQAQREVKKEFSKAGKAERGIAKTVNTISPFQGDSYSLSKAQLTNFARHKFQTLLASFLILTTVALSCFFWLSPTYAAKAEKGLHKVAAKTVQAIANSTQIAKEKSVQTILSASESAGKGMAKIDKAYNTSDENLNAQVKKVGARTVIGAEQVGSFMERGTAFLEQRAESRQDYIFNIIESSASETINNINYFSSDLASAVGQIFSTPLKIIPAPIRYAIGGGTGVANTFVAKGAGSLEQYKNILVRSGSGRVAGISEQEKQQQSISEKFFNFINKTAQGQKRLSRTVQQQSNEGLNKVSSYQRVTGEVILNTLARITEKANNFVDQKIANSKSRVLGIQENAEETASGVWEGVGNGILAVNNSVTNAKDAWESEGVESKKSLAILWATALDYLLPDALKQKIAQDSGLSAEQVDQAIVEPVIVIGDSGGATTVITRTASLPRDFAIDNIIGSPTITGDLAVDGETLLKRNLAVRGRSDFQAPVYSSSGDFIIDDNLNTYGSITGTSLNINGIAAVNAMSVNGLTSTQNLAVSGDASVGGTFTIAGQLFSNNLSAAYHIAAGASLSSGGSLAVSKNAVIGGDLSVRAGIDVDGTLNVDRGATIGGGASITGNTTIGGSATVSGNLAVAGTTVSSGQVSVTASTTDYALLVNQEGSGNIFQLQDSGINVMTVYDGGNVSIGTSSSNNLLTLWGSTSGTGANLLSIADSASTTLLTVLDSGYVGIGTSTPIVSLDIYATDAVRLPIGTTAQRPTGGTGMLRFNTSTNSFEGYNNTVWGSIGGGAFTDGGQTTYLTAQDDYLAIGTSTSYATLTLWATSTSGIPAFNIVDNASSTLFTVSNSGNVGIGTTTPSAQLSIAGTDNRIRLSYSAGNDSNIYTDSSGNLNLEATGDIYVRDNLVPVPGSTHSVGSNTNYWTHGYFDELTVNTLGVASTTVSGTLTSSFTINSDAVGDENASLVFYRGGGATPNATLGWVAVSDRFEFGTAATPYELHAYGNLTVATTTATSTFSTGGLTVGINQFVVQQTSGNIGIGTTTPNSIAHISGITPKLTLSDSSAGSNLKHWYMQSTGGALYLATTSDALSDTALPAFMINSSGNIGIGTTSPDALMHITGTTGGTMILDDSGGVADDRLMEFDMDGGALTIRSLNDALTANNDNILVLDNGTGNVRVGNFLEVGDANNDSNKSVWVDRGFTATANAFGIANTGTIIGAANSNIYGAYFANNFTEAGSGTHSLFAQGYFASSTITGAGASLTDAMTLYVGGAPSGATNNYGLYVDASAGYSNPVLVTTANNRVGIGTANPDSPFNFTSSQSGGSSNTFAFNIEPSFTGTPSADTYIGERVAVAVDATGSVSSEYRGLSLETNINQDQDNVVSYTGSLIGAQFDSLIYGNNVTATDLYGGKFRAGNVGSSAVTNVYAGQFSVYKAAGTIDNAYGIYIDDISKGSTNNYAIYSAGGDSYFSGNIGIGTSSPYAKLSVVGQAVAEYFTATSTSATSTFPYLTSTQSNVGTVVGGLWQGTQVGVNYGGTGLTTAPNYGQLLVGNSSSGYSLAATSTLKINTDNMVEGSSNLYFTNARARGAVSISGTPLTYDSGTGVFGINQATLAQDGYLSSADFTTFNNKISSSSLSAVAPLTYNSGTGVFEMPVASASVDGYLSATNWNTFNNKWDLASSTIGIAYGGTATTTFVSDGIVFYDGSTLTQDTTNFIWNDTDNRLGIGTSSPWQTLSISGGLSLTGAFYDANASAGSNFQLLGSTGSATDWVSTSTLGFLAPGDLSASTPLAYDSSTGVFTISQSTLAQDGYLSSADFTTFNNKISSSSLSATAPLTYNSGTGVFEMPVANGSTNGYLSSANWTTFNNKQATISVAYPITLAGAEIGLAFGTTTANTWSNLQIFNNASTTQLTVNTLYDNDGDIGGNGQILSSNGTVINWIDAGGSGTVTSVDMSVPTGLAISGNPITAAGTLALAYDAGYAAVRTASTSNWNTFYDTPSTVITDGTGLSWSDNTLNAEVQTSDLHDAVTIGTASGLSLSTQQLSLGLASAGVTGALSGTDWTTFNNKWDLASSTIGEIYGGTGQSSYTTGDMLYSDATDSLAKLGISTAGYVLTISGGIPTWTSTSTLIADTDFTANGIMVRTSDGAYTSRTFATSSDQIIVLNPDGVSGNPTFDLRTTAVTSLANLATVGTISAGTWQGDIIDHERGGLEFDASAITTGGIVRGASAGTMEILALGTGGQILGVTGGQLGYITTSTMPFISNSLTKGYFMVGDDSGTAQATSSIFISSIGNIGIGTSSPNHTLDINGNLGLKESQYVNWGYTDGESGYGIRDNSGAIEYKASGGSWAEIGSGSGSGGANYGAAGSLTYYETAGTTATGTTDALLFWDNTNTRLGIGTSTPYSALSVWGQTSGTGASLFSIADNASTTLMTVLDNGRVGIGTTTPTAKLTIQGAPGEDIFTVASSTGASILTINGQGDLILSGAGSSDYEITPNDGLLGINGYVGIGSSTPIHELSVVGSGYFTAGVYFGDGTFMNSASNLTFTDGGSTAYLTTLADNLAIGTSTAYSKLSVWADGASGATAFNVVDNASSTLFTVLDDGNVGIGTTSPYAKLSVVGQTVSEYFTATSTSATSTFPYLTSTQSNVGTVVGGTWQGGTVGVAYGGTGAATLADGFVLLGSGTGAITPLDVTGLGSLIVGDGTTDPTTLALGTGGQLLGSVNGTVGYIATSTFTTLSNLTSIGTLTSLTMGGDITLGANSIGRDADNDIDFETDNQIMFRTNATDNRLLIDSSGNVGIGTSSPNHTLDINGNLGLKEDQYINWGYTDGESGYGVRDNSGTIEYKASGGSWAAIGSGGGGASSNYGAVGALAFYASAGTTATGTDVSLLTWDSANGRLGIGSSSPNYLLSIASSTATNFFRVATSSTGDLFTITDTQITASIPMNINTTGDVQIASDLQFTDSTSASILSNSPMYITAGDAGQSVSLFLEGSNAGEVVVNDHLYIASSSAIGVDAGLDWVFAVDHDGDEDGGYAYVNNSNTWTSGSADYAEFYWTEDIDLGTGEAVCIDITRENAVKRCARGADGNLMGIVSTKPAFLGNAPGEEHRENNPNYVIVGMLGQVPAKVSAENGEIRPGDALTSSAVYPGHVMKAGPGDPTVGVALEGLKSSEQLVSSEQSPTEPSSELEIATGEINVLISRRNKSLTVEEVEQQIIDRIAAMEIEDEVAIMVQQGVDGYDFDPVVEEIIGTEIAAVNDFLNVNVEELQTLIAAQQSGLANLSSSLDANGNLILNQENKIVEQDMKIAELEQRMDSISSVQTSSSTLTVINNSEGNIAEFKNASSTILAINSAGKVQLASDTNLVFGDEEEIMMAYNSDTHQMEIIMNNPPSSADYGEASNDLYVGLGAGRMIVAGAIESNYELPITNDDEVALEVRGSARVDTHASSTATALTVEQDGSGNIVEFRTVTLAVMTIENDGDITVSGGNMEVCVGACPDTETYQPSAEGDLGVEATVFAEDYRVHCPEGWVEVPRDNKHTFQNFCVQKHEANENNIPIVNLALTEAKNYCRSMGPGVHLTTDAEWMTIAENIVGLPINDISAELGLQLANGISNESAIISSGENDLNIDTCNLYSSLASADNVFTETCQLDGNNRVAVLSNGQVIWDVAGNAAEWTDNLIIASESPVDATPTSEWLEYSAITKYANMSYLRPSGYNWTSANGIGQIYTDYSAGSATRGSIRGGSYLDGERAGVFGLDLSKSPEYAGEDVGFRCAR